MVQITPGVQYQTLGVPMQYVQQATMPTLAHPLIQNNGKAHKSEFIL